MGKRVEYRCSDETGVGVRMRLLWKETKGVGVMER